MNDLAQKGVTRLSLTLGINHIGLKFYVLQSDILKISKNDEGVSKILYTKLHVFPKFEPSLPLPIEPRRLSLFRVVYGLNHKLNNSILFIYSYSKLKF